MKNKFNDDFEHITWKTATWNFSDYGVAYTSLYWSGQIDSIKCHSFFFLEAATADSTGQLSDEPFLEEPQHEQEEENQIVEPEVQEQRQDNRKLKYLL